MAAGKVQGQQTRQGYMEPAGYVQLTSVSAATGLGTIPDGVTMVMIQPETQNVRWRDDGTNPTTTVGALIVANDILYYSGPMASFKLIEVTASAKVNLTFYK